MRERWFGATGRKITGIALEGTVDLEGALVLDDVSDLKSDSRSAPTPEPRSSSDAPTARRCTRGAVAGAPVACALVADESLLALDLAEMTYG